MAEFSEVMLPVASAAVAPDGSDVRVLARLERGSMAHFELGPHEVSRAIAHRTVDELWFIVEGLGRMWRSAEGVEPRAVDLRPGLSLSIPAGTAFQFINTGQTPLAAIGVTMPAWPGDDEAISTAGPWTPTI